MYAFCNFLSSNSLLRSNTLGVTIKTKQITVRVEIIPSYLNDYMPNKEQSSLSMEGYLSKKSIHINESFVHAIALALW